MKKKINYKKQGKKNRTSGARFELLVRKDLENKGWVCTKWGNNVEWDEDNINRPPEERTGKCIPAKRKYNPFNRVLTIGTGFPDFIAYQKGIQSAYDDTCINMYEEFKIGYRNKIDNDIYGDAVIIFVECKTNGYLDSEEREKAQWYLENNFCSKFLIASKEKEGRKIVVKYKDFEK